MAGGEGTRLRPLTCNIPKSMMPIMNKPIMEYAIKLLKKHGITEIGVTLQYLPDEIINYFGNGKEFGVELRYFIEDEPLGTAGSVKNGEDFLDDTFVVLSSDALTDIDLTNAIEFHYSKKAMVTLVVKEVQIPLEYGVVVTDNKGKVTKFLEKPSWSEVFSNKVNTGIYVLEPEIFKYYEKNQKFDFSNDLFPMLISQNKPIYAHVAEEYWCDIGSIEEYINCHLEILKGETQIEFEGNKIRNGIWIGENCEISPKAIIGSPVFIGSGTKINDGAVVGPYTVLGKNNIISSMANIKRSISFEGCYVGNNAEIRGAVLCKKVQIESKVCIFEEAAIGSETLIKERAIIKPNVKIWPNKVIEKSTIVRGNIIWGGKFSKSLFGKSGISGEVNIDITPELISKIGSSYGSLFKNGSKIAISCSNHGASQMFKYSLATGLLSMGIEVYDLKKMTTSIMRQLGTFFGVSGSINVSIDEDDHQKVKISFLDGNGLDIDKATERKIENYFIREEFRRVRSEDCRQITHINDGTEYYVRNIINQIGVHKIREKKYNIVLGVKNSLLSDILNHIFNETKITVKRYEDVNDVIGLQSEVINSNADMGIILSQYGDKAIIIDGEGTIISDDKYEALNALLMIKRYKLKNLVVPVTSSYALEEIATTYGVKFIRTKSAQKNILDAYIKNEKKFTRKEMLNIYLNSLDAVSTCMRLISFMAEENIELAELTSEIPLYYNIKQDVLCPWSMKGKVMRNLIEENNSNSVDLIEGVKLNFDEAWALIYPDADEPLCRVYTEAKNSAVAEKLTEVLLKKIQAMTVE